MKAFSFALFFILFIGIAGAGLAKDSGHEYEEDALIEAYARRVFISIARQDMNAFIKLCVHPKDLYRNGKPIMYKSDVESRGVTWKDRDQQRFTILLKHINDAGGIHTFKWVRVAKIAGKLDNETGFVGNIWVVVSIGGKQQIMEIGATYMSRDRGRVLSDAEVRLITMTHYQKNYQNLPF